MSKRTRSTFSNIISGTSERPSKKTRSTFSLTSPEPTSSGSKYIIIFCKILSYYF